MTGETDIRIERQLPDRFCAAEGRFQETRVRQTKPIAGVSGLKTGLGEKTKANWSRREAENGDWYVPRSGLYLPPLSDGSSCKQICKAKPIFRGFGARNADLAQKQSQSKPIWRRRPSLRPRAISSRILPARPGPAAKPYPAGCCRAMPGETALTHPDRRCRTTSLK